MLGLYFQGDAFFFCLEVYKRSADSAPQTLRTVAVPQLTLPWNRRAPRGARGVPAHAASTHEAAQREGEMLPPGSDSGAWAAYCSHGTAPIVPAGFLDGQVVQGFHRVSVYTVQIALAIPDSCAADSNLMVAPSWVVKGNHEA